MKFKGGWEVRRREWGGEREKHCVCGCGWWDGGLWVGGCVCVFDCVCVCV